MNLSLVPAYADAVDQAARRWHAQFEVNGALLDAGLLDEDGYHWRALSISPSAD